MNNFRVQVIKKSSQISTQRITPTKISNFVLKSFFVPCFNTLRLFLINLHSVFSHNTTQQNTTQTVLLQSAFLYSCSPLLMLDHSLSYKLFETSYVGQILLSEVGKHRSNYIFVYLNLLKLELYVYNKT